VDTGSDNDKKGVELVFKPFNPPEFLNLVKKMMAGAV
jgi:hypothetical protein